jgi:hypothetical protein
MTGRPRPHLHLDLEPGSDPIAGRIYADGEPGTHFVGWMELTRTIERSLDEASRAQTPKEGTDA